ncbi:MAG: efflux RND transporter periplasmic adaptor subunit [Flavobacteriales bacterium]
MNPYGTTLTLGLLLCACGSDHETLKPTVGPITESVYANGIVKARGQYNVFPTVNGTVTVLLVKEGDTVKAGQPLLRIDDRTSNLMSRSSESQLRVLEQNASDKGPVIAQLRAALAQAQDKLILDSTNYLRQQALWSQQIGSKNELDQRSLAYSTSKSTRDRAAEALVEARNRLRAELDVARNNAALSNAGNDDRTLRSLIDGRVYDVRVEPGELATTQKPIAIIGSATDLYLQLEVDEKDIALVKPGQSVLVSLEIFDGYAFDAVVTRIVPIMDERSRTFTVEAEFKEKPPALFPNLTAEASIMLRTKEQALTIPAGYVIDDGYVLTGPDERTPVRLGARDLQRVEVTEGIDSTTVLYKP